jgi:omega-6 fatty acid desaturase (delta-12 desaturase)
MWHRQAKHLRNALEPYARRSTVLASVLLLATLAVYGAGVAGAVALDATPARLAAGMLAGSAIASLFVIGHDAAHGAYTDSRRLNALFGRVAFLPALHNYSLWQVQHNRLHHRLTNLKSYNSWSPLTKAEYDMLPGWRRALERLYRGPLGFAPYYLIERWWKDKFFPKRHERRPAMWLDFALLIIYLAAFMALLAGLGQALGTGAVASVLFGFVVPFVVWNAYMGATTYIQHTHPRVAWFEALTDWRKLDGQQEISVQLSVPRWYGLISHHIMDHPAHHVHPKIPLYRIAAAQRRLNEILGERAVIQRFSPRYLLTTLARCKLYDFRRHCWLDFAGRPTSECTLPAHLRAPAPMLRVVRSADAAVA